MLRRPIRSASRPMGIENPNMPMTCSATESEMAESGNPVLIQGQGGHGHHHVHIALDAEHGHKGGELWILLHEGDDAHLGGGPADGRRRDVVRIVVREVAGDLLRVGPHLHDDGNASDYGNWHEEPRHR